MALPGPTHRTSAQARTKNAIPYHFENRYNTPSKAWVTLSAVALRRYLESDRVDDCKPKPSFGQQLVYISQYFGQSRAHCSIMSLGEPPILHGAYTFGEIFL